MRSRGSSCTHPTPTRPMPIGRWIDASTAFSAERDWPVSLKTATHMTSSSTGSWLTSRLGPDFPTKEHVAFDADHGADEWPATRGLPSLSPMAADWSDGLVNTTN